MTGVEFWLIAGAAIVCFVLTVWLVIAWLPDEPDDDWGDDPRRPW